MAKEMVISANPHETRVAILEDGQLCEIYVEREKEFALVGSIYKGRVTRVLPGMQSCFVDIGLDGDAFLYVSDFLQDLEEFDHIEHAVEEKVHKMEEQGGQVFPPPEPGEPVASAMESADVALLPGETIRPISGEPLPPRENGGAPPREESFQRSSRPGRGRNDRGKFGRGRRDRGRGGRPGSGRFDSRGRHAHGRELPSSKYASHRPYEPADGSPATPFEAVLLPGESLSVLKERPADAPPPAAPEEGTPTELSAFELNSVSEPASAPETFAPEVAAPEIAAPETRAEEPYPSRGRRFGGERREHRLESTPSGWLTALEPLPGETIAKAKANELAAETVAAEIPSRAAEEIEAEAANEQEVHASRVREHEIPAPVAHHEFTPTFEEPSTPDLTEEEANALAEQVAEAQQEEAERDAEEARAAEANAGVRNENESDAEAAPEEESEESLHAEQAEDANETEEASNDSDSEEESSDAQNGVSEEEAEEAARAIEQGEPVAASRATEEQPKDARVRGDFRARMQRPVRRGGRDRDRGRGGKRFHGRPGHHRGQPRRTQLISELLKAGQEIIVQIAKEPLGKKGARITSHVALPGRFLVYMPTLDHTGVSRKIASAEERSRLRHLVNDAKGAAGGGFIVRTAASAASPDEVREDVQFLTKTWSDIKARSEQRKAPSLLHRDLNLVERILRDYLSSDYTAIWVDSEEEYTKVLEFVSRFQPQLASRVKLYSKEAPIFEEFGIQQEIDKGLRPKVWLKSGGYIVINHTEALVAIDVNTGKFVGRGSTRLEDTIVRTNAEAAKEIVRQIRLRDLGGIIIIDFIDMEERRNREKVMAALEEALKSDRAPSKVLRFNEFGLVAITRKRTKQALERTLCQPCPYCTGSGMVKSLPTLCYEIQSEARKMAVEIEAASLTLRVHPEVAKALKTRESELMDELERVTRKSIIIQADPTLHWEQYDIY